MRYHYTPIRVRKIKNRTANAGKYTERHCWQEYKTGKQCNSFFFKHATTVTQ